MCFWIFKRDAFKKDAKKYVQEKFNFLIEKGYEYSYFFCNCETSFGFLKNNININVYYDVYPTEEVVDLVIYKGKDYNNGKNIREIISFDENYFKNLSSKQKIDFFAELLEVNIEKIENTFS